MKKLVAVSVLVLLSGGLLLVATSPGANGLGFISLFLDEDQRALLKLASGFLEAIQYKDFKAAGAFHNELDSKKVNIPALIEQLFKVKPEVLNIRDIKVTRATVDSSGNRARTFFKTNIEFLNSMQRKEDEERRQRDIEGVLYWQKENGKWVLKLESSLQGLTAPGGG